MGALLSNEPGANQSEAIITSEWKTFYLKNSFFLKLPQIYDVDFGNF